MLRYPCVLLVLTACGPSFLGPIPLEIGPESPDTTHDIVLKATVPRAHDTFRLVATTQGREIVFEAADLESEPHQFEGRVYTAVLDAQHTARDQVWTIDALATKGRGELRSTEELTIRNAPPSGSVTISPDAPSRADAITVAPNFADPDGDALTFTYRWEVNGAATAHDQASFPAMTARRNDRVRVTVVASDGTDESDPISADVTLRNAPPVAYVELSPAEPHARSTILAMASGEDADDDPLTFDYSWTINGVELSTTAPELLPGTVRRDDEVMVRVVARDGRTLSEPAFDTVTVLNSPPTLPEIAIDPPNPTVVSDFVCAIVVPSTDADRDPISYLFTWFRNGEVWTGATATTAHPGDTILADATVEGERWACEASATDHESTTGPTERTPEVEIGPPVAVFNFTDTTAVDVSQTAIRDFFDELRVSSSDYIFFEVYGSGMGGAWCAERADWYVSEYLSKAGASSTSSSGSWQKWHRPHGGAWSAAVTSSHTNYWGSGCGGLTWNWCSEWGMGGRSLAVMPGNTSASGESYANQWSSGRNWEVTIKVAPTRRDACDF